MHRRDFVFSAAGLASLALTAEARAAGRGGATHVSVTVPHRFGFVFAVDTGMAAPLKDVRFIFGGNQDGVRIMRIQGQTGNDPDGAWDAPGATPHEATRYFARHPFSHVASTAFWITVDGLEPAGADLQVTVTYG